MADLQDRRLRRVVAKAAIFDADVSHVVVIRMPHDDDWGLPGGHLEEGEHPEAAIGRELWEEAGVRDADLTHCDFFVHGNGKIVLDYVAKICHVELVSQQGELEGVPMWIAMDEFLRISIDPAYRDFVISSQEALRSARGSLPF